MCRSTRDALLLVGVILGWAATVSSAADGPPANRRPEAHCERPGGPFVTQRAQRTSPPLAPELLRRGRFQSVQVNVNALGQNIVGDAANEPSIAVDPTNPAHLVVGWRQFDSISSNFRQAGWAHSHDAGYTWTFPGALEYSVFRSDPVLDVDAEGNIYYYSLTYELTCQMFKSLDHGRTWLPKTEAFGGDKQWMAIDRTGGVGHGNIYAAWSTTVSGGYFGTPFTRSTDGGMTWDGPFTPSQTPVFGTLTVDPEGDVYVAGIDQPSFYSSVFRVIKSTNAKYVGSWPTFTVVNVNMGGALLGQGGPNPVGLLGQVWIAADHSDGPTHGYLYMLASVDPPGADPLDVHFVRSTNGGASWSSPIRVNDDAPGTNAYQWFGTMSVAPNGRIDVIWNDTRNSGDHRYSEIYYSYSTNAGLSWSTGEPITPMFNSHLGWPQQQKLGDYYDLVSDDVGANLIYAATFNGEQDVYFLRLGQYDCNGNGIDDAEDIASGTSQDVNGNSVPDECEPDCNENDIPDEWDIALGLSEDCTGNGIPDECEPDCNDNGLADSCDIAAGTSEDCSGNGIPDECEPDCNDNGMADSCDLQAGTSDDINGNGIPDECEPDCNDNGVPDEWELTRGWRPDCNGNAVPDECDIADGTSTDLNGNEVPDECEPDCNDNAVPDDWDIATGASADCNYNTIPDECDVAAGTSVDVNGNGVPDECEPDCNNNGVPDDWDISTGTSADCNGNGIPDTCDLSPYYLVQSPRYAPLGSGYPHTHTLTSPPDAVEEVTFWFHAKGDLRYSTESVDVSINGTPLGTLYAGIYFACEANQTDSLVLPADTYNALKGGGDIAIEMVPSAAVNPLACDGQNYIDVAVSYVGVPHSADLNGDGIPDECQTPPLCAGDMNCDGLVDYQDIDLFVAALACVGGDPGCWNPACPWLNGDTDGDEDVTYADIDGFVGRIGVTCP